MLERIHWTEPPVGHAVNAEDFVRKTGPELDEDPEMRTKKVKKTLRPISFSLFVAIDRASMPLIRSHEPDNVRPAPPGAPTEMENPQ